MRSVLPPLTTLLLVLPLTVQGQSAPADEHARAAIAIA